MFEFESEEQRNIRQSVRKIVAGQSKLYGSSDSVERRAIQAFSEFSAAGLSGLSIAEEFGGLAQGAVTTHLVMEELSSGNLGPAITLSVHLMVCGLIQKFGSDSQKKKLLPALARGEILAAFALTEPQSGSDAASLKTQAKLQDTGWVLNGDKCYISSAGIAQLYLVFTRNQNQNENSGKNKGISAFLVESTTPGLHVAPADKKMGAELSPIASLNFTDMFISSEQLLGQAGDGFSVAMAGLCGGRINIAACANGIARAAIDHARNHLQTRSQFGKKLIDFQGLQFILADMQTRLEAAQLLTWQAAKALDQKASLSQLNCYASMAKCFATDAAMQTTTDAVQLLGGAGYLQDYQVERLMREAKMLQIVEGTNQIQRLVIAREMIKQN